MIGSIGDRMLGLTLPHVAAWNVWWSDYGNTPDGFATLKTRVDGLVAAAGRSPGEVEATAAVMVRLEGGGGRQMGEYAAGRVVEPLEGTPSELADTLQAFEAAGAAHLQLVVDPINADSIECLGGVLELLKR